MASDPNTFYTLIEQAEAGNIQSMRDLIVEYTIRGKPAGVFIWTTRLAEEESPPDVHYKLGLAESRRGGNNRAFYWFNRAASAGHVPAYVELGWSFRHGRGVERNYSDAFYWYNLAANAGHISAQYILGELFELGHGIEKNVRLAVHWYRRAIENGYNAPSEARKCIQKFERMQLVQ